MAWNANEGAAYLLDTRTPQILRAAFDPQLRTLPAGDAWVGIHDATQLRRFPSVRLLELGVPGHSDGIAIYDMTSRCFYHLHRDDERWQLDVLPLRTPASLPSAEGDKIREPKAKATLDRLRWGEPRFTEWIQLSHALVVPIRREGQPLRFGAACTMALDSPSSIRSSEELCLIVTQAASSSSMHLPIMHVGDAAFLVGTTAKRLPLPAVIDGIPKSVGYVVVWPLEPQVFGQYALFQFLAVDGRSGDVACSEVVGCQISLRR